MLKNFKDHLIAVERNQEVRGKVKNVRILVWENQNGFILKEAIKT